MDAREQSQALHEKVQAFAQWALGPQRAATHEQSVAQEHRRFDELANEIKEFQLRHCPALATLHKAQGAPRSSLAVPSDVFRLSRVACHPPEQDSARFHTSGTTAQHTGWHGLRTVETYRALSTGFGRKALLGDQPRATVIALMNSPLENPHSSLIKMCEFFMEAFDGRSLPGEDDAQPFATRKSRWLLSGGALNEAGLRVAVEVARARGEIVLLLATSLSLALLLEQLPNERIALPAGSVVMPTGGSKGRAVQLDPAALRASVAAFFEIEDSQIISEYGMTELSSQLYEATLLHRSASPGVYCAPPWLRATPVDPITLLPVAEGALGLAQFTDLANIDSALCVLTQDLIRSEAGGVRLLGRQPRSPSRGCSLLAEPLLVVASS
ncbi:MAG TPA: acyl-protein synthetase [Polyangiaceae bacterium]|nr:acyl-protein synthetase [Polyangiaceae bacterium]